VAGNGIARDRTPEEVRAEIERTRSQLALTAQALRSEVEIRLDWREWVRRKPWAMVAGAFMVGFVLGNRRR
jgi:hypothetical protein